ncbi:ribosome biogenesis GTPase [Ruminococcus flavefaciens]|uniref:Small ribosomal subunit biogenesis GTPase RsgA n=1 Tax=Ruminococcus flavefaciens TaxID=1265 RepID=A0A1H6IAX0_RUMFL|nr:ribosome small subunit-dependent GTPase A [Ruminococcus flavefaciens]SEH45794.1 ribosome biogenesis GTPase [Ruminococcus flavefaciens]
MKDSNSGIIIKCLGGLYSVESPDGIYECKARGVFRNRGISPCVGDRVTVEDGVITEIADRKNCIIRPPLANLDQLIFIVSTCEPAPNYLILDKFIAIAEYKGITPVVVITKTDLGDSSPIHEIYGGIGIDVVEVKYDDEASVEAVRKLLTGKISAFTGNSGAGKSTLLNAVDPTLNIATGEISKKLGRGRHTTRHAELYKLSGGGYIADTPGFSTFETNRYDIIRKEELAGCFREFEGLTDKCRFRDCAHVCEKGCAVVEAVERGEISKSRHESYKTMYEEAKQLKEWELK